MQFRPKHEILFNREELQCCRILENPKACDVMQIKEDLER